MDDLPPYFRSIEEIPSQFRYTFGDGIIKIKDFYYFSNKFADALIEAYPHYELLINNFREPKYIPDEIDKKLLQFENLINYKESKRTIRIRKNKEKKETFKNRRPSSYIPKDYYFKNNLSYHKQKIVNAFYSNKDDHHD